MKNLNLVNKLTLFRIALIPFFVFFYYFEYHSWVDVAAVIFIVACITDRLEGYIARKYNMVTDLGKILDLLADKILVISVLICFVEVFNAGFLRFPTWAVIIIVAREFVVTVFIMAVVAKDNKAVIAADIWGKLKTAATMVVICSFLALQAFHHSLYRASETMLYYTGIPPYYYNWFDINIFLLYICTALAVFSGITMIYKNRKLFSQ